MRKFLLMGLVIVFALIVILLPPGTISLAALQHYQSQLATWHIQHPWLAAGLFFLCYVVITTFSIPGATLLTLLGGALFGLIQGTFLVALSATCGATFAMLISRYLLRDWVRKSFSQVMQTVNQGMARDGDSYLLALRLTPVFPFFMVNLLMGLTSVSARRYFAISLVGILPATVVYLNAGRQLSQLATLSDILTPRMMLTFALLGLLPLASRWLVRICRASKR